MHRSLLSAFAVGLLLPHASAQFTVDPTRIPQGSPFNDSTSESVEFADVDLDGDWDAVFADGGDPGNDQNRIWINLGGLQAGTTGFFDDQTAARFPAINDSSRDIEFGDIDADGDQDLYVANASELSRQSSRWWINSGGRQGGSLGFYADETAQRWGDLSNAESSLAPSALLPGGGFESYAGDGDFADLDNDGDLDLVHSSLGIIFNGQIPTRLFLNDGNGYFSEFNPSGAQLTGLEILQGSPALWAEGSQAQNTSSTNGGMADIASASRESEVADFDGDFDLDLQVCNFGGDPRLFANRLEGSLLAPTAGNLIFRDVTTLAIPAAAAIGELHYEQAIGDLDGDGDPDLVGINWDNAGFSFNEVALDNDGAGQFTIKQHLPGSFADDTAGDLLDYDADGDLDLYVASFSGVDRLYRNNNNGGADFSFDHVTSSFLPDLPDIALDTEVADLDGDGDYDLMIASRSPALTNLLLVNETPGSDSHPPYLPHVEQPQDRTCSFTPTVLRAQVYDNAPDYITQYNQTWVSYTVNGGPPEVAPARSSGGQIFRAEIPGWLSGTICFTWHSQDEYGNEGTSAPLCYQASGSCQAPSVDCVPAGGNSVSSLGAQLRYVTGEPGEEMVFRIEDAPSGQFGILYYGSGATDLPFGCGRRCISGQVVRSSPYLLLATSQQLSLDTSAAAPGLFRIQYWYRDPNNLAACGNAFNLSSALAFP